MPDWKSQNNLILLDNRDLPFSVFIKPPTRTARWHPLAHFSLCLGMEAITLKGGQLCGADILPTSPIPTTLIPVQLRGAATVSYLIGTAAGEVSVPALNAIRDGITDKNSPAKYAVIESPQASGLPWQWLDTPGTNLQSPKEVDIALLPGELADLCVVVTPATQPLSLSDLNQVVQLRDYFPGNRMCIALTRCDQITPQEQISIRQHMDGLLKEVIPDHQIATFCVSSSRREVQELETFLLQSVLVFQRKQLARQIVDWDLTLQDLDKLLAMTDLAPLKSETIERLRATMQRELLDGAVALKRSVPQFSEEALRSLGLPSQQRALSNQFRATLLARVKIELQAVVTRVLGAVQQTLQQDLPAVASHPLLVKTLSNLFALSLPDFVDREGAMKGALFGALLEGLAAGPSWGLSMKTATASMAGGLFGGMLGSGQTLYSIEQVREGLARPLTTELQVQLDAAIDRTKQELMHFCDLLEKATKIFANSPQAKAKIPQQQKFLKLAMTLHADLKRQLPADVLSGVEAGK